jgi:hypothetical protein
VSFHIAGQNVRRNFWIGTLGLVANPTAGAQDVGWWGPCHPRGEAVSTDPGGLAGTMLIAVAAFLLSYCFSS